MTRPDCYEIPSVALALHWWRNRVNLDEEDFRPPWDVWDVLRPLLLLAIGFALGWVLHR